MDRKRLIRALGWALAPAVLAWLSLRMFAADSALNVVLCAVPGQVFSVLAAVVGLGFLVFRRWRVAAICGLSALAWWLMVVGLPAFGPGKETPDLVLASYNVMFAGRGEQRVALQIKSMKPDILCTQESRSYRPESNAARAIGTALPAHEVWQSTDMITATGPAVLVMSKRNLPLADNPEGRDAQVLECECSGHRFTLINVHLRPEMIENERGAGAIWAKLVAVQSSRVNQVRTILETVRKTSGPVIVCGDFNCGPTGAIYQAMERELSDAFAHTGSGYGWTLLSDIPLKRIDFVWTRGCHATFANVPDSRASDHRPLLVGIKF